MRALSSVLLVACTLTIALGLAAISASFRDIAEAPTHVPGVVGADGALPHAVVFATNAIGTVRQATSDGPVTERTARRTTTSNPSGSWRSPLYPQNGVSLWDRIRTGPQQDRQEFLLGTAIQVHTPDTAATPGPRFGLPSCFPCAKDG